MCSLSGQICCVCGVSCAALQDCRAIRDILGTVLLVGNYLNAVSSYGCLLSFAVKYDAHFYRAMHFSAKRGIAIACRLSVRPSVCLSVCNVGEL